jgi:ubiquinone/menaquinone biosynthesis C-methylase UbiE
MRTTGLDSNVEWKKWGEDDPLFGVSALEGKQKGGPSPWTDEEFYALGESDWSDFSAHWQRYGLDTESCLEFGCGAGRVTKQLSSAFKRVYAVDVSEGMIRRARTAVGSNVEFSLIDGSHLPQADSSIKAVFSSHVLQHLDDVSVGYNCFREFYRVLSPSGSLMVHLPLYILPHAPGGIAKSLMRFTHRVAHKLSGFRAAVRRRTGTKTMRGTPYPLDDLNSQLTVIGFRNIEFRIFPVSSNGSLHPFVFASK